MHMADALISAAVGSSMFAASAAFIGYSVKKIKNDEFIEKKIPIMAVAGAFVFAAQMINFAIPGTGSSGHIGGGILLVSLLGSFPALLVISSVLIIQSLFFADGGLLALGCNIFNLGVIPCLLVYPILFRPILKNKITKKSISIASVLAVVVSLQIGAFCVVLQTLISNITELPFKTFVVFMQFIHFPIGIIEGLITAAILCFVFKMQPEILESSGIGLQSCSHNGMQSEMQSGMQSGIYKEMQSGIQCELQSEIHNGIQVKMQNKEIYSVRKIIIFMVFITIASLGFLYFASSKPDGLEWSIEKTLEKNSGHKE